MQNLFFHSEHIVGQAAKSYRMERGVPILPAASRLMLHYSPATVYVGLDHMAAAVNEHCGG